MIKNQFCDFCGELLGTFEWSHLIDGPLTCGEPDCERAAREDERARDDEARQAAQDDDYGKYRYR